VHSEPSDPQQLHTTADSNPGPAAQLRADLGRLLTSPRPKPAHDPDLDRLTIPQLDDRLEAQLQLVALDVICDATVRGIPGDEAAAIAGGFIASLRGEFAALIAAAEKDATP